MQHKIKIIYKVFLEFSDKPAEISFDNKWAIPIRIGLAGVGYNKNDSKGAATLLETLTRSK